MLRKKMNKSGGITIPQILRSELGVGAGTAFDIVAQGDGILITKYAPTCRFCGNQDNIIEVNGNDICKRCSDDIAGRFSSCK